MLLQWLNHNIKNDAERMLLLLLLLLLVGKDCFEMRSRWSALMATVSINMLLMMRVTSLASSETVLFLLCSSLLQN
jgi:hypothetical protein